jgi:multicomponent K+:H+ antiporter subunit A
MLVPAVISRLLLPVAIVVATHFFLRGHNAPGGGFVAGLVLSIALLMQYVVSGTRWVESRTHVWPARWIAAGLLLGVATGLGAFAFGYPFMTTHTGHLTLPWIGDVHLPTAAFFDLAVLLVVVGATVLILTALAHQSIRTHREAPQRAIKNEDAG